MVVDVRINRVGHRSGPTPLLGVVLAVMSAAAAVAFMSPSAGASNRSCGGTGSPLVRIGNVVFDDADGSGTFDPGESGIDGVTVELWLDRDDDGVFEPTGDDGPTAVCEVTTSAGGHYWLSDIDPARYFVAVASAPDGNIVSPTTDRTPGIDHVNDGAADGTHAAVSPLLDLTATLPVGERAPDGVTDDEAAANIATAPSVVLDDHSDLTIDFGFTPPPAPPATSSLGDQVWIDADRNGMQDPGEAPVAGVTLLLLDADGNTLASTVTDAEGRYTFDGLTAGTYSVCLVPTTLPPGMVVTVRDAGTDDSIDSDFDVANCTTALSLGASTQVLTLDLGIAAANVDLAITKEGTWSPDTDSITWSIAVRNLGNQAEPGSIVVTDILPTGLGDPTITPPSGMACNYAAPTRTITCTSMSALPAGSSLAIGFTTTRTNADTCGVSNTATVRGSGVDASTANNVATATVSVGCGTDSTTQTPTTTPMLPATGGTVLLVVLAATLAGSGRYLLHLSDNHTFGKKG